MATVRPAAVAGMFYPGTRDALAQMVGSMLAQAGAPAAIPNVPKAIVAPHAGYIYSGPVAARLYALLVPARPRIRRVVLLGPAHRVAVRGLALPGVQSFATPLGEVMIDETSVKKLETLPYVSVNAEAHRLEHALEVQLPFLQTVLDDFRLVPLAVGHASAEQVATVLDLLWGGDDTLIVISSDLSHYHPYAEAKKIDAATTQAILTLRTDINHQQACGATPVTGLNLLAQRRNLKPQLTDLRNSGDTAGDKSRVVGYGSFAYYESTAH